MWKLIFCLSHLLHLDYQNVLFFYSVFYFSRLEFFYLDYQNVLAMDEEKGTPEGVKKGESPIDLDIVEPITECLTVSS